MFDSKEYTRLRDIAVKRSKRLYNAGLAEMIHIPTVKEIRAGMASASEATRELKDYLSGGSTVKAVRVTGLAPVFRSFPEMPKPEKKSTEQQKAQKRERDRKYRQRKRIRENLELSPEKLKKYEGYLKALDTVAKTWKKSGFNIGIDLASMTPSQAQAFVEYMDFRFSQGDFTQRYVIDEFVQDFSKLLQKGYKGSEITKDFNQFLEDRKQLENRSLGMEGLGNSEIMGLWSEFVER